MPEAGLLLILKKCFRTQPALYKLSYIHFIIIFYFQLLTSAIVRKMDWVVWGVTQAAKTGVKIALNAYLPGSGIAVDFVEAAVCYCSGDVTGCTISLISGVTSLSPVSPEGVIKGAMESSAKEAVVQTAKETAKSAGKEATRNVGQDLAKKLAMGTAKGGKDAAIKTAKAAAAFASKEATRKVGQQVGEELAKGLIPSAVEGAWYEGTKMTLNKFLRDTSLSGISSGGHEIGKTIVEDWIAMGINEGFKREPLKIAFELAGEAAEKGANEEFMKQSYKILVQDVNIALLKGGIRLNQGEDRK